MDIELKSYILKLSIRIQQTKTVKGKLETYIKYHIIED